MSCVFSGRETRYRQLFAKQTSNGYLDFRAFSDVSMEDFADLIERQGSSDLKAAVTIATDITSEVSFKRFVKATTVNLEGTYYSEDIDVVIETVKDIYAGFEGKISKISTPFFQIFISR